MKTKSYPALILASFFLKDSLINRFMRFLTTAEPILREIDIPARVMSESFFKKHKASSRFATDLPREYTSPYSLPVVSRVSLRIACT
jgi:hypothetical protein